MHRDEPPALTPRAYALLAMVPTLLACSEPACPRGYMKKGSTCSQLASVALDGGSGEHPEGGSDEASSDAATALCLPDEDGDGFGPAGTKVTCNEQNATVMPGDCDDRHDNAHPDASELCGDNVDNNCDGEIDEPIAELCNGIDDNCDGRMDELLAVKVGEQVWTDPRLGDGVTPRMPRVAVLERGAEGAWLLYKTLPEGELGLNVHRLDEEGKFLAGAVVPPRRSDSSPALGEITVWAAASDDNWIAILSAREDSTAWLQLFGADDFSFVAERQVHSACCGHSLAIDAVSLLEDASGAIRVTGALRELGEGDATWHYDLQHFYVNATFREGSWESAVSRPLTSKLRGTFGRAFAYVARLPCRDEWLLTATSATDDGQVSVATRVDALGVGTDASDALPVDLNPAVLEASDTCSDSKKGGQFVIADIRESQTFLHRYVVDGQSGRIEADGEALPFTNALGAQMIDGRWFVAGVTSEFEVMVYEVDWDAAPALRARPVQGLSPPSGASVGTFPMVFGGIPGMLAIRGLGRATVMALVNSFNSDYKPAGLITEIVYTNLNDYRSQALPNPDAEAAVVTYTFGCSQ